MYINKERSLYARKHTEEMDLRYKEEIKESIKQTKIYDDSYIFNNEIKNIPNIKVIDSDSVSAVVNDGDKSIAVLNFASYKYPGGGFINGSRAQEECLCLESNLYNVLKTFDEYYTWNKKHLNNSLYLNRGLYSPKIVFIKDNITKLADVLTVAAPNYSKYQVSKEENSKALYSRIKFVLDIANDNNISTLILGAYGCGVFNQDPMEVANIFKELINNYNFKNVIFAIPNSNRNNNFKGFKEVFN